jgi:hypothetical protein
MVVDPDRLICCDRAGTWGRCSWMEVGTPDVIVAQHYTWKGMCGARESARGLGSH